MSLVLWVDRILRARTIPQQRSEGWGFLQETTRKQDVVLVPYLLSRCKHSTSPSPLSAVPSLYRWSKPTVSSPSPSSTQVSWGEALPRNPLAPSAQGSSSQWPWVILPKREKAHLISTESQFLLTCLDLLVGKGTLKLDAITYCFAFPQLQEKCLYFCGRKVWNQRRWLRAYEWEALDWEFEGVGLGPYSTTVQPWVSHVFSQSLTVSSSGRETAGPAAPSCLVEWGGWGWRCWSRAAQMASSSAVYSLGAPGHALDSAVLAFFSKTIDTKILSASWSRCEN